MQMLCIGVSMKYLCVQSMSVLFVTIVLSITFLGTEEGRAKMNIRKEGENYFDFLFSGFY